MWSKSTKRFGNVVYVRFSRVELELKYYSEQCSKYHLDIDSLRLREIVHRPPYVHTIPIYIDVT